MSFIANARMYAVAPEAEAAWRELIARVTEDAGVAFDYMPYPAPQPLEDLWSRGDLGAVQMCGYPIALRMADVAPLAAPVLALDWAEGRAAYRSDLIVRKDAPYKTLADTFGGRLGWTVEHSHSGFNALRRHLMNYRTHERPKLYREAIGPLVTARKILDSVLDGSIDVGPLDGYWHALIAKYKPELTSGVRILESTALAPAPAFVASAGMPAEMIERLRAAFAAASSRDWFPPLGEALLIRGFAPVKQEDFAATLRWDAEAKAANYTFPA
ncbi:phosphate/phosphite/phosphonate ABC transporter substrate-binding protein [Terrarubrum flagellatum]|uniref:phosphate/phosphite/phosphonate ABC transporter substrate-binding protein n=1 Tax=Terrirubrum flagellatum TaxID=2895980 RepID=UPI003144F1A6